MTAKYQPLALKPLPGLTTFFKPHQELPEQVSSDSPALLAMTDFRQVTVVTIEPGVSADWALHRMKEHGVRMLLVTNASSQVLGVLTATDLHGEKLIQVQTELGRERAEITVRDVMTPHDRLEMLMMDDVLRASVGDIVATLRRVGRQHALVLDEDKRTQQWAIRGMFSSTHIGRQLGRPMEDMVEVATTFVDMEIALNG